MAECKGNNSDSIVKNEVSVGMSTRQLQDLLTNAISTLRSDITIIETNNSEFQVECSNLRPYFLTITVRLDYKLQAVTENIAAKIQQENEQLSEKMKQNYTMKFRNCLVIFVLCVMTLNISFKKSLDL